MDGKAPAAVNAFAQARARRPLRKGAHGMTAKEEWVIWNGSLGVLDMVTIGRIEDGDTGKTAFLASPYGVVGPFSLDELEALGRIVFGACLVMSRRRWQEDQNDLRREAQVLRRRQLFRLSIEDEREYREVLNLLLQGALGPSEINSAFRRLAKTAHPDAGGANEEYHRITEARDALLKLFADDW
jgi:hypothetical protein